MNRNRATSFVFPSGTGIAFATPESTGLYDSTKPVFLAEGHSEPGVISKYRTEVKEVPNQRQLVGEFIRNSKAPLWKTMHVVKTGTLNPVEVSILHEKVRNELTREVTLHEIDSFEQALIARKKASEKFSLKSVPTRVQQRPSVRFFPSFEGKNPNQHKECIEQLHTIQKGLKKGNIDMLPISPDVEARLEKWRVEAQDIISHSMSDSFSPSRTNHSSHMSSISHGRTESERPNSTSEMFHYPKIGSPQSPSPMSRKDMNSRTQTPEPLKMRHQFATPSKDTRRYKSCERPRADDLADRQRAWQSKASTPASQLRDTRAHTRTPNSILRDSYDLDGSTNFTLPEELKELESFCMKHLGGVK